MTEDLCDPPMLTHLVLRLGGLVPELLTRRSAPDLTAQRPRDSQPSYKMTRSTSTLLPQMMVAHKRNKMSFPGDSDKKSTCSSRDPGSVSGWERSPGEGNAYPLHYSWDSLVAQTVKNLPAMPETQVRSLGREDPLQEKMAKTTPVFLPGELHGQRSLAGYSPWGHKELDVTEHIDKQVGRQINIV